jgi:bifunctional dethiobiotin synthetase / adenosylmethionine---8-amino-7-oxononanoate aminotransferase
VMLWRDLKAWQVYGANTDVGKTIISTILCRALQRRAPSNGVLYLKPVSTGPLDEADDRHITRYAPGVLSKCITQFSKPVSPHLAARLDSASEVCMDPCSRACA